MTLYCTVCRAEIPEKRTRQGAHTCSKECATEKRARRLQEWKQERCGACGRKFRQRRDTEKKSIAPEASGVSVAPVVSETVPEISSPPAEPTATSQFENQNLNPQIVDACAESGKGDLAASLAADDRGRKSGKSVVDSVQNAYVIRQYAGDSTTITGNPQRAVAVEVVEEWGGEVEMAPAVNPAAGAADREE